MDNNILNRMSNIDKKTRVSRILTGARLWILNQLKYSVPKHDIRAKLNVSSKVFRRFCMADNELSIAYEGIAIRETRARNLLTKHEHTIIEQLNQGMRKKVIVRELGIGYSTFRKYLPNHLALFKAWYGRSVVTPEPKSISNKSISTTKLLSMKW